jgi:RND family efflux transporter MFP subunit
MNSSSSSTPPFHADPPRTETAPNTKGTLFVLGIGLLVLLGFMGYRVKQSMEKKAALAALQTKAGDQSKQVREVSVITPGAKRFRPLVELTGTLKPWREADIGFESPGRLVKVGVTMGQVVKTGELLGTLDGSRAGAQVNQATAQAKAAQAGLSLAEDNLKRTEALAATKAIADAQVEQARQNVQLARAQLDAARATTQVAQAGAGTYSVVAPFPGLVTRAPSSPGGVVNPGVPLFRLEDVSHFRLAASVGEEEMDLVSIGAKVTVQYRDRTVVGKVSAMVPSLEQGTRRAPIEVDVPNDPKAPLPGYGFVRATLESGQAEVDALSIPLAATRLGSQDEVVIVDAQNKFRIVRVMHAVAPDGSWIIRKGLSKDDRVVMSPPADIKDGEVAEKVLKLP